MPPLCCQTADLALWLATPNDCQCSRYVGNVVRVLAIASLICWELRVGEIDSDSDWRRLSCSLPRTTPSASIPLLPLLPISRLAHHTLCFTRDELVASTDAKPGEHATAPTTAFRAHEASRRGLLCRCRTRSPAAVCRSSALTVYLTPTCPSSSFLRLYT